MASTLPQNIKYYKLKAVGHNTGETHDIIIGEYEQALDINGDGWNTRDHTLGDIQTYLKSISKNICYNITPFLPGSADSDWKTIFPGYIWQQFLNPNYRGEQWTSDIYMVLGNYEDIGDSSKNVAYFTAGEQNRQRMVFNWQFANSGLGNLVLYAHDSTSKWFSPNLAYRANNNNSLVFANYNANETKYVAEQRNYWQGVLLNLMYFMGVEEDYEIDPEADPLEPGGISAPGGGTGDFDASSDTIGVPNLPSISAIDTGLLSAYAPNLAQVQSLAAFLWDTSLDWSNVQKVINEPIKTIFGFSILPFTPDTGTARPVKLGNMTTNVSMPPITSQWKEIDCGELAINEYWGSYLDYGGYTDIKIYLPYIGIVPIDTDDVMGRTLKIVYHCDCISGACVAYVLSNGSQIATYNGQMSANVPLTSNDFANTINGILGLAGNVGSLVASGGATAASAIPGMASNAMNAMKPNVQKSGALAGTGGIMGTQYPFLIAQRPRQSLPDGYNKIEGYPSNISAVLGTLHGYTKVENVEFEGLNATEAEKDEIKTMLQAGVIL